MPNNFPSYKEGNLLRLILNLSEVQEIVENLVGSDQIDSCYEDELTMLKEKFPEIEYPELQEKTPPMKKAFKNPRYTEDQYNKELTFLRTQQFPQPSFNFIQRFHENTPNTTEVNNQGYWGEDSDFYAWGYALFGHWESGEIVYRDLNIPHWENVYSTIAETTVYNLVKELTHE